MRLSVLLLLTLTLTAETRITFSPSDQYRLPALVWNVQACSREAATIPAGRLFQALAMHGARPLTNTEALDIFHARQTKSVAAKVVLWSGYAAVAGGYLMTANVIKVKPSVQIAVTTAGGFLSVLVPLAQREIPPPLGVEAEMMPSWLQIPPGGCAGGLMLGSAKDGYAFEVVE